MPIVILFSLATDKKYASIPINSNNNKIGKINLQYLIIVRSYKPIKSYK